MVLITGCPLLNVEKREITDFLLKRAQTVRSFCATHGVKTKLPTKLLIRYFSFLGFLGKAILENLHGNRLIYIVPVRKSLRLFGGNVVEQFERRTCNSVAPSSSPALTASWICFTVVPSSHPRPRSWIADWICRRPDWIFNAITYVWCTWFVSVIFSAMLTFVL